MRRKGRRRKKGGRRHKDDGEETERKALTAEGRNMDRLYISLDVVVFGSRKKKHMQGLKEISTFLKIC